MSLIDSIACHGAECYLASSDKIVVVSALGGDASRLALVTHTLTRAAHLAGAHAELCAPG